MIVWQLDLPLSVQSEHITTKIVSFIPNHGEVYIMGEICLSLVANQWFSPGTPVSFTNKTDRQNIPEILLKYWR